MSFRSGSRTLAGCMRSVSRPRSCSERGPPREQARWCGASPWSAHPVATQEAAPGSLKPGRGDSVETPTTGVVGTRGWRVRQRWGKPSRGRAGRRSGASSTDFPGHASDVTELRLRGVRARPWGALEANADAHGVAPPRGERLGVLGASVDGRWALRGLAVAYVSAGRVLAAKPGRVPRTVRRWPRVCSGRTLHVGWALVSTGRGAPRLGCPRAVSRSQRASVQRGRSAATGHSKAGVASRASGGNTANAPKHSLIRFPRARVDSTVEGCG
jgi:hypothetical protein